MAALGGRAPQVMSQSDTKPVPPSLSPKKTSVTIKQQGAKKEYSPTIRPDFANNKQVQTCLRLGLTGRLEQESKPQGELYKYDGGTTSNHTILREGQFYNTSRLINSNTSLLHYCLFRLCQHSDLAAILNPSAAVWRNLQLISRA